MVPFRIAQVLFVDAEALGIESTLDDAARPEHDLALELGRTGPPAQRIDPFGREAFRPTAAALRIQERNLQPAVAAESRLCFAHLRPRLSGVDGVISVRRSDEDLKPARN